MEGPDNPDTPPSPSPPHHRSLWQQLLKGRPPAKAKLALHETDSDKGSEKKPNNSQSVIGALVRRRRNAGARLA